MPVALSIKIDETSIRQAEQILSAVPKAFPRAMRRAVNRTVDMAATDLKRRVGKQVRLKAREIARGIGKKTVGYGSTLTGSVRALPHRPGLIEFKGTRQLKRGVKYRIGAEGFKTISDAFIAEMGAKHRGVFKRKGPPRLPIKELRGPSIWQIITGTPGLLTAANAKAAENLNKQLNSYVATELKKWTK